jgi:hypothetical protein
MTIKEPKLPSKRFWNNVKVMTKHWEDKIRADERRKCYEENRKTGRIQRADEPCPQNESHKAQRRYCINCVIEREKEAYAKGKEDAEKRLTSHLELKALEKAYKKGQAEMIERLKKEAKDSGYSIALDFLNKSVVASESVGDSV